MNQLVIDGASGEGGGQIVRSSLALSLLTGRPVRIEHIRAGRQRPGLMHQHLAAVRAAAQVGRADVRGGEIGSRCLEFSPRPAQPGDYEFKVGTAGSATLVLQTILPALLIADTPSRVRLEGGTHNPWAPPFDFLDRVFLPLVNRLGPKVSARLVRHGFYPAGGGWIEIEIAPTPRLSGLRLVERGNFVRRRAVARVANLADHIAEREARTITSRLDWLPDEGLIERVESPGPGNVVFAELEYQEVTELFTGFGRRGARAEHVAEEVVAQVREYLDADAPVGHYLADQLLLPLGIAAWQGATSEFRATPLSLHSTTHVEVLRQFLGVQIDVGAESPGGVVHVHTRPPAASL